jgi:hypothetical protein
MSSGSTPQPLHRAEGVTPSERYLQRLGRDTFLSLWSHASIYRDQGQTATSRQGKEVCDLLVAFQNYVIIFSDKLCEFPDTGNLATDWCRWFRKAVLKSAEQVWGAERWIRRFPHRLFLDRDCTQRFPFDLPDPATATFHRVVVAHGASRRCRQLHGGSGSMMLRPRIVGDMHYSRPEDVEPFAIGDIDPNRGYVHVIDDTTLGILMRELDTAPDFIEYLTKKERFVRGGRFCGAAGEEEMLAYYLRTLDGNQQHDFVIPDGHNFLGLLEGLWYELTHSNRWLVRAEADEVSYT